MFNDRLIYLQEDFSNQAEVFNFLTSKLLEKGLVKAEFLTKISEREAVFPTGLTIGGYGVAIPHTDSDYVNQSQIAYVSLVEPVIFKEMGNDSVEVAVTQVFMLALKEAHEQLETLQKLIEMFQNEEHMAALVAATTEAEIESVLIDSELIK